MNINRFNFTSILTICQRYKGIREWNRPIHYLLFLKEKKNNYSCRRLSVAFSSTSSN
jgi:hypothetical protein